MYKVVINYEGEDVIILDHKDPSTRFITDAKLTLGISSEIATFDFTIFPSNPGYFKLIMAKTLITIYDLIDGETAFQGRVASVQESMNENGINQKVVTCESDIAMLYDAPIFNIFAATGDLSTTLLNKLIETYNEYVEDDKKFYMGECSLAGLPVVFDSADGMTAYEALQTIFESSMGGEVRIRHSDGKRYIDFTTNVYGENVETPLMTKVNIKEMEKTDTIDELFTRIIPLGASLGTKAYSRRLTILPYTSRVPDLEYNASDHVYLERQDLIDKYGLITKTVVFDDSEVSDDDPDPDHIAESGELYRLAVDYMESYSPDEISFTVSALDLSFIDNTQERFTVGNYYTILNPYLMIEETLRLIKMEIDITQPYAPTLTFGTTESTLSDTVSSNSTSSDQAKIVINNKIITTSNNIKSILNQLGGLSFANLTYAEYNAISPTSTTVYYVTQTDGTVKHYFGSIDLSGASGSSSVPAASLVKARSVPLADVGDYKEKHELTALKYIEGTGTQYINTGFTPDGSLNLRYEITFADLANDGNHRWLYGGGVNYGNGGIKTYQGSLWVIIGSDNTSVGGPDSGSAFKLDVPSMGDIHTYSVDVDASNKLVTITRDGESQTARYANGICQSPIMLFCLNQNGNEIGQAKVYSFRIYENGELVRDMVPMLIDGVPGLYDKLFEKAYYNSGSGVFGYELEE